MTAKLEIDHGELAIQVMPIQLINRLAPIIRQVNQQASMAKTTSLETMTSTDIYVKLI